MNMRKYLVIVEDEHEGDPDQWLYAATEMATRSCHAASALATSEFSDPKEWEDEDERFLLVKDALTGEVSRYRVDGTATMNLDIVCDKEFKQQGA